MRHSIKRTVIALAMLAIAAGAFAGDGYRQGDGYYVKARVVRAEPIMRTVRVAEPREVCWEEAVYPRRSRYGHDGGNAAPAIIGGVVGGVVGNQVGRRNDHRSELTIAGALLGAAIGHGVSKSHHRSYRQGYRYPTHERVCEIETDYRYVERIEGYRVTYRYRGHQFTTRMNHKPGKHIRVRVDVEPADHYGDMARYGQRDSGHRHVCDEDCV